jgi:hypothetical protein
MAISLCESHAKAISLLLKNDCAVEPIIVARSFFEVFCDFYWISQEGGVAEQNERVFRLEANPYREITKEVRLIEKDAQGSNPFWKKTEYQQLKALLEDTATNCPWLLNSPSSGSFDFKQAPDLAARLGPEMRLRFYHLYRFSSVFTHPTPMMKTIFTHPVGSEVPRNEMIKEPLQQVLAYGLWFLKLIMEFCQQVFSAYDAERLPLRAQFYESLSRIAEKGRKNYFSFRDPGTSNAQTPSM